jgi:hypothetical protein
MHVTAVELYQRHGDVAGVCVRCGVRAPCPVRTHAARVIAAVGEDPRWYDGRLSASPGVPTPAHVSGYAVGGRTGRMDPAGFLYERDREP